uniref:Uncharacterized protein n=1 Tax=Anopheles atroparvus TaxID=41427 RepID=A0A182JEV8_ANOAO
FTVFFAFVLAVATVAGQRFGFPQTTQFGLASLTGDFGGPTAFGGQDLSGPVVFPPGPADAPVESSGVIVGASGYGFVPPNTPQKFRKKAPPYRYPLASWKHPAAGAGTTGTPQRPKKPGGIVKLVPTLPASIGALGGYRKPTPAKWFLRYKGHSSPAVLKPPPLPLPGGAGIGFGNGSPYVGRLQAATYGPRH